MWRGDSPQGFPLRNAVTLVPTMTRTGVEGPFGSDCGESGTRLCGIIWSSQEGDVHLVETSSKAPVSGGQR